MRKPVHPCAQALVVLSLLGLMGCYSTVEVGDGLTDKAIAIDWVDPPCAVPGSEAGYIEGTGFGAENVTIRVGGIEAEVIAATGMDASFIVPAERLSPGDEIEVVVENPGGRLATIDWRVCEIECDPPDCDDGNECTTDVCDPVAEMCVHTPVGDGVACDFGGLPGVCIAGLCEEDPCENVDCDDGDPCTNDSCEPTTGECISIVVCHDTEPPVLVAFDLNPTSLDLSNGGERVYVTTTLTDDYVGVQYCSLSARGPSGQSRSGGCAGAEPDSGDRNNGQWSGAIYMESGQESGTWVIDYVTLHDRLDNSITYSTQDLQNLGFPTQFEVIYGGSPPP